MQRMVPSTTKQIAAISDATACPAVANATEADICPAEPMAKPRIAESRANRVSKERGEGKERDLGKPKPALLPRELQE